MIACICSSMGDTMQTNSEEVSFMGRIYVLDCGGFSKVGMTENPKDRKRALVSHYKISEDSRMWVSAETAAHVEAEAVAHHSLRGSHIAGEEFSETFDNCVKKCMAALSSMEPIGNIEGMEIVVDSSTGFINATHFIRSSKFGLALFQFLKNDSVKHLNEEIIKRSGGPSYFATRGANCATFVHPYLFIEINRTMGAKHKVAIYKWLLEEMLDTPSIRKAVDSMKEEQF